MNQDSINDNSGLLNRLLTPARLYSRDEALGRLSPVPKVPGIYGWYFDELPPGVDASGCHVIPQGVLLYVGIAPKEPSRNGAAPSRQSLRNRIRYHYRGNAYGSTLRLSLGCHLTNALGIALRRVGSGSRLTFTHDGERKLSEWMNQHARVTWVEVSSPWLPEEQAIKELSLPLNLQGNSHHPHYATLKALRAEHKAVARSLPVA